MLVLNEVLEGDLQAGRGLLFIWDSVPSGDTSPLQHRVLCQELGLWSLMEPELSSAACPPGRLVRGDTRNGALGEIKQT